MSHRLHCIVTLATIIAMAACSSSPSGPSPTAVVSVGLAPSTVTLAVGRTQQLAATPSNYAGAPITGKSAVWSSSSTAVATVSPSGLLTAVAAGTATISATIDGKSGSASVTVITLPVATVTLAPTAITVAVTATATLTATLADSTGAMLTGRAVTWASANAAIATVSTSGLVTGVAIGSTTITAAADGALASVPVTVTPNASLLNTATGRVTTASGSAGIAGARVTAQDPNAVFVATSTTDAIGNYAISGIATGSVVEFLVSAAGFVSTTIQPMTINAAVTLDAVPLVPVSATPGGVSGTARDASTNAAITSGVAVELRSGLNATTGLASQVTTTGSTGSYSFSSVAAGSYTLLMRGAGYAQSSRTVAISGGATLSNADLSLSAGANANQWRAILTWTAAARDLDLYLTLPGPGSTRQQIWFLQPGNCAAAPFACLDRDASTAPGPETITISQLGTGIYRFYAHNYNTPSSATDSTLMQSGAQLRLFHGTAQVASYNVPQQAGTLWTVLELDGATGTITPKNTMSAGGPGDPTMAMRAAWGRVAASGKRDPLLRLP